MLGSLCSLRCRSHSAHSGRAGSLAEYRISSSRNLASKCHVKNEFLSRTEPSSAGFVLEEYPKERCLSS